MLKLTVLSRSPGVAYGVDGFCGCCCSCQRCVAVFFMLDPACLGSWRRKCSDDLRNCSKWNIFWAFEGGCCEFGNIGKHCFFFARCIPVIACIISIPCNPAIPSAWPMFCPKLMTFWASTFSPAWYAVRLHPVHTEFSRPRPVHPGILRSAALLPGPLSPKRLYG